MILFNAIVDGKVPLVDPFVDENGRKSTLNGTGYLEFFCEEIWPTFHSSATRKGYGWMQDRNKKVSRRKVPRQSDQARHRNSPDLNPLDFHFWAIEQRRVYEAKLSAIAELINAVKHFAS